MPIYRLMQLMPATAQRFDANDRFDPRQNTMAGARYLRVLLDLFEQDVVLALAGYNAGENAVLRRSRVPQFAETRDYVPKVLSSLASATALCDAMPLYSKAHCDLDVIARTEKIASKPDHADR